MNVTELSDYIYNRKKELNDNELPALWRQKFGGGGADYSEGYENWALEQAVGIFARAVYAKARAAREKYGFHPLGWATPDWQEELQKGIAEHVLKGDPRDVGVYAVFAYFHGWPTAPIPPATVEAGAAESRFAQAICELDNMASLAAEDGLLDRAKEYEAAAATLRAAAAPQQLAGGGAGQWVPAAFAPCALHEKWFSADVLLWYDATNAPAVGYYDHREGYKEYTPYDDDYSGRQPTHWQRIDGPADSQRKEAQDA